MPEIKIARAFNFREGSDVKHYPKSDKPVEVSQAVAEHAWANDFAPKPKAEKVAAQTAAPAPAPSTEPSGAK